MQPFAGRIVSFVLFAVAALGLAACDPTPRVFATADDSPLAQVPAADGVVIGRVEGVLPPLEEELRNALVGALQAQGIPATIAAGTRASGFLHGRLDGSAPTDDRSYLIWTLTDPAGQVLTSFPGTATLREGRVAAENAGSIANIVRRVSDALVGAGRRAHLDRRPAATAPAETLPRLSILPVAGAPGDGEAVLADALGIALRNRGLQVAEGIDADGLIVFGDVLVEPAGPDQEKVSITWQVRWPDGRELGVVTQANTVPSGATAETWRPVAPVIAANAAEGIARLVRRGDVRRE